MLAFLILWSVSPHEFCCYQGIGNRPILADYPLAASDQRVEVGKEYLSTGRDAVEMSKLLLGHIDGPVACVAHRNINPS